MAVTEMNELVQGGLDKAVELMQQRVGKDKMDLMEDEEKSSTLRSKKKK